MDKMKKDKTKIVVILPSILIALVLLIIGSCGKENPADAGDPPPPPPTQEDPMKVGSDGGSVSNQDSTVTLAIPSGALSSEVTFTIEETTSHAGDAVGKVYDIGPAGTQFDPQATLSIKYDETDLPAGARKGDLKLVTAENGSWKELTTTVDEQKNTVSAEISHLSVYGILWDNPNIVAEEGGTVSSTDSTVVLEIPEGALFEETVFTFEETTTHPEGAISKVYDIGPEGAQFELPVTLTFSYDEAGLPEGTSEEDLEIAVVEAGEWKHLVTLVNTADNELSTEVTHLSVYGIVLGKVGSTTINFVKINGDVYFAAAFARINATVNGVGDTTVTENIPNVDSNLPVDWRCEDVTDKGIELYPSVEMGPDFIAGVGMHGSSASQNTNPTLGAGSFSIGVRSEALAAFDSQVQSVTSLAGQTRGRPRILIEISNPSGKPFEINHNWTAEGSVDPEGSPALKVDGNLQISGWSSQAGCSNVLVNHGYDISSSWTGGSWLEETDLPASDSEVFAIPEGVEIVRIYLTLYSQVRTGTNQAIGKNTGAKAYVFMNLEIR